MMLGVDPRRFRVLERFRPRLRGGSEHRARTRDEEVGENARGHFCVVSSPAERGNLDWKNASKIRARRRRRRRRRRDLYLSAMMKKKTTNEETTKKKRDSPFSLATPEEKTNARKRTEHKAALGESLLPPLSRKKKKNWKKNWKKKTLSFAEEETVARTTSPPIRNHHHALFEKTTRNESPPALLLRGYAYADVPQGRERKVLLVKLEALRDNAWHALEACVSVDDDKNDDKNDDDFGGQKDDDDDHHHDRSKGEGDDTR